jgi:tetratricopeptide (TPR) repeat protein
MVETGAMPMPEAIDLANPHLDELLSSDPENDNALTYRGRTYDFERNYAEADAFFRKSLQLNSRNAYTLTTYGKFLFDRGQVDQGLGYLQQAQQIEPYDIKLQWNLCSSLGRLVDEKGAVRECGRIGDIEPGNPMQFYGMQYLHDYRGEKTASLLWRTKALEADPDDIEIAGGFVFEWLGLDDLKRAEKWAAKTAGMNPDHPAAVVTRVALLQAQERYQEALEVANKAFAEKLPDRHGSNQYIYQVIVNDAVNKRDFSHALEVLMALLPEGVDSPLESQDVNDIDLMSSIAQVIKLQEPGSEQIGALLDHAEQLNLNSDDRVIPHRKPFRQATIEVVRGNKELAIAKLEESIRKGWRFGWREIMQSDFQFEPLHREPAFQDLVAYLEADMEKQRTASYEALGITP